MAITKIKNCKQCGADYEWRSGEMAGFRGCCSIACAKHWDSERSKERYARGYYPPSRPVGVTKTCNCEMCGSQFQTKRKRRFCSDTCLKKRSNFLQRQRNDSKMGLKPEVISGNCEHCGRHFQRPWRGCGVKPSLCSNACKKAAYKLRTEGIYTEPNFCRNEIKALKRIAKRRHRSLIEIKARRFARLVEMHIDATRACVDCDASLAGAHGNSVRCDHCRAIEDNRQRAVRRKARKLKKRGATVECVDPIKVFQRDGWRCHLCGGRTVAKKRGTYHPLAPELDHIVPIAKGGDHSYANTACSHRKCNAAKSDRVLGQPSLLQCA